MQSNDFQFPPALNFYFCSVLAPFQPPAKPNAILNNGNEGWEEFDAMPLPSLDRRWDGGEGKGGVEDVCSQVHKPSPPIPLV